MWGQKPRNFARHGVPQPELWYRPTELTLKWWDLYTTTCRGRCDDQRETNKLFDRLAVKWLDGIQSKLYSNKPNYSNDLTVQRDTWKGPLDYHSVGIFDGKKFVQRKPDQKIDCKKNWQARGDNCTIFPGNITLEGVSGKFVDNRGVNWDITGLQLGIVDRRQWMRDPRQGGRVWECDGSRNVTFPFIYQPLVPKRGYEKAKMFETFKSCFEKADA